MREIIFSSVSHNDRADVNIRMDITPDLITSIHIKVRWHSC